MTCSFRSALAIGAFSAALLGSAAADPIRHPTAIFAGLDKTTGRIINFDVAIDETVQFGSLNVTPRVCNTRPQTEAPQTSSFVEVDEIIFRQERQVRLDQSKVDAKPDAKPDAKQEAKRIFSGWMFAGSPGLHGVEHPVYDVWLVDCKGGKEAAPPPPATAATDAAPAPTPDAAAPPSDAPKKKKSRKVEPKAPAPVENAPIGPADQTPPQPAADTPTPDASVDGAPAQPAPAKKKKKKAKPAAAPADGGAGGGGAPLLPF